MNTNINWIDIAVVAIIAVFAAWGFKRGLIKSVVGILSLAASIVLAWALYPVIAKLLEATDITAYIHNAVQGRISEKLTPDIQPAMPQLINDAVNAGRAGLADGAADTVTGLIVNIFAFIAVLVVSRVIIWAAAKTLNIISKLPIIGTLNRISGLLLGTVQGALIVCILLTVVYAVIPLRENPILSNEIEGSVIAKPMYISNPITKLLIPSAENEQSRE